MTATPWADRPPAWRDAFNAARRERRQRNSPRRLDDIDPVAVLRAVTGNRADLNRGERRAAVAELTRRGVVAVDIADRVGASARTVVRDRAAMRVAA